MIYLVSSTFPTTVCVDDEPPLKKRKVVNVDIDGVVNLVDGEAFTADADDLTPHLWISRDACYQLNEEDKTIISSGEKLTDKHINFAQEVFKSNFPFLMD